MKLKRARAIVESDNQIIYAKHEKDIERKIKALRKRAGEKKNVESANKFREKANEYETLLRANFHKRKEMSHVQHNSS
jgi:hypothetical protein